MRVDACKQKNSICIPIEKNTKIGSGKCECKNPDISYVCICQTHGQSYIDSECWSVFSKEEIKQYFFNTSQIFYFVNFDLFIFL